MSRKTSCPAGTVGQCFELSSSVLAPWFYFFAHKPWLVQGIGTKAGTGMVKAFLPAHDLPLDAIGHGGRKWTRKLKAEPRVV